jgi:hypothetical protein
MWSGRWDPYSRNIDFLDRSRYYFFKLDPNCTQEAEWAPFQTHYFSDNLVATGIEPGPLDHRGGLLSST